MQDIFKRTTSKPLNGAALRKLNIGLMLFLAVAVSFLVIKSQTLTISAPYEIQLKAKVFALLVGGGVFFAIWLVHRKIQPFHIQFEGCWDGTNFSSIWFTILGIALAFGGIAQYGYLFRGGMPSARSHNISTYEAPIIGIYRTDGRRKHKGFLTLAIDPSQGPVWHILSREAEYWSPETGRCLRFALVRTPYDVRYIDNFKVAPCSVDWPSMTDRQRDAMNSYGAEHWHVVVLQIFGTSKSIYDSKSSGDGYRADPMQYGLLIPLNPQ